MCEEYVKSLKPVLSTLSANFSFTITLKYLMERDFALISQREAYETLRYILTACGQLVELNEQTFSDVRWKSPDPEVKKRIEKCKNYVFETIKKLCKENKILMPKLKKSDLLVPYCAIYFNSCLSFASYALSYQLEKFGIYFWPRMIRPSSVNANMLLLNLKEEDGNNFDLLEKNFNKEIVELENAILELKKKKKEINFFLEIEIDKCKYRCGLREESARVEILASWKQETDDLHNMNLQRIKSLEDLNVQLSILMRLTDRKEKFIISGEKLVKNIQFEVENFAQMNGLALHDKNQLNIPSLFKTLHLSIPKSIKNDDIMRELLFIKPPEINSGLSQKLEIKKKKLEEKCENFHRHLGENIPETITWLGDFLFYIPKVNFTESSMLPASRDPIFDEENLRSFSEINDKNSQNKTSTIDWPVKIEKDGPYSFNRKRSTRKIADNHTGMKRDRKNLQRMCKKRKSISLVNISMLSASSFKSMNSEKVDSPCGSEGSSHKLCSTPKENYNRSFIYDKSISPISVHSGRDKSIRRQGRNTDSSDTNDSILTESNIQVSLLNSYLSIDLDSKSEKKHGTFEITTSSVSDVSLDGMSSILSMNLSM